MQMSKIKNVGVRGALLLTHTLMFATANGSKSAKKKQRNSCGLCRIGTLLCRRRGRNGSTLNSSN